MSETTSAGVSGEVVKRVRERKKATEVTAIARTIKILDDLDPIPRKRVVAYLILRFAENPAQPTAGTGEEAYH
jgi:hypothetical protein